MKKKIFNAIPIKRNWLKIMVEMKMTIFLILVLSLGVSASSLSQNQKVNLNLKDAQILDVFKEIKEQTGLRFIYNNDKLESLDKVDINASNETVKEVLDEVFKDSKFECQFKNNVIMVVDKKILPKKQNQPKKIKFSGTVYDAKGEPIPYAAVMIKGTTLGAVTGTDGVFVLEVPEGEYGFITASSVGMVTQEIEIKSQTRFRFILKTDIESLSEVLVTGYQTISAERATGAFENVKVESLLEQKTTDNALDLLEGEVPGLLYENMGEGEPARISLRGLNNFNMGDSQVDDHAPLVVLDGFPINGISGNTNAFGNYLTDIIEKINPADIENISVLKDAAAASIWGAQAANGVIVITTKKGKKSDKPRISFNSSFSIREMPNYSDAYVASVDDYLELDKWWAEEGRVNAGTRSRSSTNPEGVQAYMDYNNGDISEAELAAKINGLRQNYYIKEYSDLFLRNYTQQQYNLSISQGNEKYTYRVALNYQDQNSFNKGVGNQNYGTLINLSTELFKGVKFITKIGFSKQDVQNNGINSISRFAPYTRILDDNGDYIAMNHAIHPRVKDEVYAELDPYLPFDWDYNLKREFENQDNSTEVRNTDFQARLDIDIFKGLKAELTYDYQYGRNKTREYANEEIWDVRNRIIGSAVYTEDPISGVYLPNGEFIIPPGGGTLDGDSYASWSNYYRGMVNYTGYLDANKKHFVTAIVGIDYGDERYEGQSDERLYNFNPRSLSYTSVDNFPDPNNTDQHWNRRGIRRIFNTARVNRKHDRYLSNYTNVGYTYNDKYTLTGSWRLDDSNLFGSSPKYRNVPLWSTGLKWRLTEEDFMNVSFLNRLDLRVSYGIGGRIDKSSSPFLTARLGNDTRTQVEEASISEYKNEELRWEKTATLNAGFDFAMFNNRLTGSFEYYRKYTSDVLGYVSVNRTFGVEEQVLNYGEISNKGFDLSLNYRIIQNSNLNWDMGVLVNHNVNKVERFDGTESIASYVSAGFPLEGYGLSDVFAYRWAGLSPENGTVQVYNENDEIVGWFDPKPTKDGLQYMGQLTPKFFGNYRNRVSYKGLSLDVLLTYKFGHVFKRSTFASDFYSTGAHEDASRYWKQPGDEAFTDVPALTRGGNTWTYLRDGSQVYEDASLIRIQSIGLNYKLNNKLFANNFIKSASVGVNARNLGLLWKATDRDIDPDYGNRQYTYKNRSTYSMNLKINF